MSVPLIDRAGLPAEGLAALAAEVAGHTTPEKVVRWGYARQPVAEITDVVEQDEYTHDVLVPLGERLVLVYDAT